jgi:hypothetical protein
MENNVTNYVIDCIIDRIDDWEDITVYPCDFGWQLFEQENSNGSATYNTEDAKEWIKQYFDTIGGVAENIIFGIGADFLANPFVEPEKFMVQIMLEVSSMLVGQCEIMDQNWNDELELTEEVIKTFKSQLEALRDKTFF